MREYKCKICRRLGEKLFLKGERCFSPKCAMVKRPYPPGPSKKRRSGPPSKFKESLVEKQKLRNLYGLSERQFKRYVKETLAKMGRVQDVGEELIKKLEMRLDNVVFRLGFVASRDQARQLVSHAFFLVNDKPINVPSFLVKKNDVIKIKESKKQKAIFKDLKNSLKRHNPPSWLSLDKDKLEAKVIGEPTLAEVKPPVEISLIFEFYSK